MLATSHTQWQSWQSTLKINRHDDHSIFFYAPVVTSPSRRYITAARPQNNPEARDRDLPWPQWDALWGAGKNGRFWHPAGW